MLGDAYSGKTALAKRLVSYAEQARGSTPGATPTSTALVPQADSPTYSPTIGTELHTLTARYNREDVAMMLWDVPGNERFHAGVPAPKVGCDVCILVVDATSEDGLLHLDTWHDEYVRNSANGVAMPAFVVALTKSDAPREKIVVFREDVAKWCARQHVEPVLWPKEVVGEAHPTPPVVVCSAVTGDGISTLLDAVCHRSIVRQTVNERCDQSIALDTTKAFQQEVATGTCWTGVVFGDVRPPPEEMFGASTILRVPTDSGGLLLWVAPHPLVAANAVACRNANVAIINLAVSDATSTASIRFWQEIVMREGSLRDIQSIAWVVVGWHTPTRTVDASLAVSNYCMQHDIMLIEMPRSSLKTDCDNAWHRIAEYCRKYTLELVLVRTQSQGCGVVPCPNLPCSWSGRMVSLETHLTTCDYVTVRCRWEGCTHTCPRARREGHEHACSHRPPTCHFCGQVFHGALYEHLVACVEREKFERSHVPCPMASIGCSSTLLVRGELKQHIDSERVEHMQLLSSAFGQLRSEFLEQDRYHRTEIASLKDHHAHQIESLRGEVLLARAVAEKHQDALKEVQIKFQLVWEELDELRKAVREARLDK